jgi:hypothetical protein
LFKNYDLYFVLALDSLTHAPTTAGMFTLQRFHLLLSGVFAVTGSIQVSYPIDRFVSNVELLVRYPFVPSHHVGQLNLTVMIAIFMFGACLDHGVQWFMLRSNSLYNQYEKVGDPPKARLNKYRWVEYAVTATTMTLLIAASIGIVDVIVLALLAALRLTMLYCGARVEHWVSVGEPRLAWESELMGFWCFACTWAVLLVEYITLAVDCSVPAFVHAIIGTMLDCELSFGAISVWGVLHPERDENEGRREIAYCVASLTAKQLLSWLVYSGFRARQNAPMTC